MKEIAIPAHPDETTPLNPLVACVGAGSAAQYQAPAMQELLTHIGSQSGGKTRFIRLQWALDLVHPVIDDLTRLRRLTNDEERKRGLLAMSRAASGEGTGTIRYVWDSLDSLLDSLVERGLKPVISLMGNPGGRFRDLSEPEEILGWSELIRLLALHLLERYGADEVRSWLFESWNEPELPRWGMIRRPGIDEYLAYYDACSHGLAQADPNLKFGGPSTAMTLTPIFQALLRHCSGGVHTLTGEKGVRLDFISFHEKGMGAREVDVDLQLDSLLEREQTIRRWIHENTPTLSRTPLFNNEADPQAGSATNHGWRATSEYVAHVVRTGILRMTRFPKGSQGMLIGLRNARVGDWGERTLMKAWFDGYEPDFTERRYSESGSDEAETGHELVAKPALHTIGLVGRLGDRLLSYGFMEDNSAIGWVAARSTTGSAITILVTHWTNVRNRERSGTRIGIRLDGVESGKHRVVRYRLSPQDASPFDAWNESGAPLNPTEELLHDLQQRGEQLRAGRARDEDARRGKLTIKCRLDPGSVELIVVGRESDCPVPSQPGKPVLEPYRGVGGNERVLLRWRPIECPSLSTYKVFADDTSGRKPRVISGPDLTAAVFRLPDELAVSGNTFWVQAEDLWGRLGEASEQVEL